MPEVACRTNGKHQEQALDDSVSQSADNCGKRQFQEHWTQVVHPDGIQQEETRNKHKHFQMWLRENIDVQLDTDHHKQAQIEHKVGDQMRKGGADIP